MKIEIDQSGKIENTNKLTALGFSNSKDYSIIILAKDKKLVQKIFRELGQSKIFIYKLFSIGVFVLIKDYISVLDQVIIDREYPGYERLIKQMISELFEANSIDFNQDAIHFKQIGKKSNAHLVSHKAFVLKKANKTIKFEQISKYIK